MPQPPQFIGSLWTLAHAPPQSSWSVGQPVSVQAPFKQASPAPQELPQAPQLRKLACVSTHVPLQSSVPTSQPHLPAVQIRPGSQGASQAPQLAVSLCRSTQALLHSSRPVPHDSSQRPALQTSSAPQDVAQSPQCAASLLVSIQLPQSLVPAGQTQPAAPEHSSVRSHAVWQSPQWVGSLAVLTQLVPQVVSGSVHCTVHTPRSHTSAP